MTGQWSSFVEHLAKNERTPLRPRRLAEGGQSVLFAAAFCEDGADARATSAPGAACASLATRTTQHWRCIRRHLIVGGAAVASYPQRGQLHVGRAAVSERAGPLP